MAGAPGFEPGYDGIKIRCLTAWRRPNTLKIITKTTNAIAVLDLRADIGTQTAGFVN